MRNCISEKTDRHGYWWRYEHREGEPAETLEMAIRIADCVAGTEAAKRGATYVVATTPSPAAVCVFAADHPDARNVQFTIMFGYTPAGERVCQPATAH